MAGHNVVLLGGGAHTVECLKVWQSACGDNRSPLMSKAGVADIGCLVAAAGASCRCQVSPSVLGQATRVV